MMGTNSITIQAPLENLTIAMITATTAVETAPNPLMSSPGLQLGYHSRKWRFAIPDCDSVNEVKTPSAYSGIMLVTLARNTTITRLAAAASATMPFENTSLCP